MTDNTEKPEIVKTWGYNTKTGEAKVFDAPDGELPEGWADTPAKVKNDNGK